MIRIVCPFCHSPLSAADLETATFDEWVCLVCPECEQVLLMDKAEHGAPMSAEVTEAHA
jgi:uncharacterized protein YbaR (Trm112 family)